MVTGTNARPSQADRQEREREFYKQPPYVRVSFFVNDKEIILNNDFSFILSSNSMEVKPLSVNGARFLFPPRSEPLSVAFKQGDYKFTFADIPPDWLKHGGEMVFGVIQKLDLLKNKAHLDGKFDSDYAKRVAYYEGRNAVWDEYFDKSSSRKNITKVELIVLQPRTFGDGGVLIKTSLNDEELITVTRN